MVEPFCTALANTKGGVGRTTFVINIADRLADRGDDVLVVDATEQAAMRSALTGLISSAPTSDLTQVVAGAERLGSAVTSSDSLDFLVASEDDDPQEPLSGGVSALARFAQRVVLPAREEYDHLIIDTPPSVSPLSDAALSAADQVVLPTGLNEADLRGLVRTIETQVVPIRRERPLSIAGIVPNRIRGTAAEEAALETIRTSPLGGLLIGSGDDESPLSIRERTAFPESWRDGLPLAQYDPTADMIERFDTLAAAISGGGRNA